MNFKFEGRVFSALPKGLFIMPKANRKSSEQFTRRHVRFLAAISNGSKSVSRRERIELFFDVIKDAPHGKSCAGTKEIADTVLNTIEDQFSNIPYAPPKGFQDDGRIYPAFEDQRRASPSQSVATYRHKFHYSSYGKNGAILICDDKFNACVDRIGSDGLGIGDLLEQSTQKISSGSS